MGWNKLILRRLTTLVFALSIVFAVVDLLVVSESNAQVDSSFRAGSQAVQAAAYRFGTDATSLQGSQTSSETFAPITQAAPPSPNQNNPGLIRYGRMVSTGIRRQQNSILNKPRQQSSTDDPNNTQQLPDPFGEKQQTPADQGNLIRPVVPQNGTIQRAPKQSTGQLPDDVFKDPFKNENRIRPKAPVVIPGEMQQLPNEYDLPDQPDSPLQDDPRTRIPRPRKSKLDSSIDYKPGRGFSTLPSQSNVYQPPGSYPSQAYPVQNDGIYFVPAYEPIPGLQTPQFAPPTTIQPEPPVPHFMPSQQQQWAPHQNEVPFNGHDWQYENSNQPQTVYTDVVAPQNNNCGQGPVSSVRRGLLGKIKSDLHQNWGIGDFDPSSCFNQGCLPAFYFGFQGTANDAFDLRSDQGSELITSGGTAFMFSLGRMNGNNLRTEAELSFRSNDVSSFASLTNSFDYQGQVQTFSGMANAYWEFTNFPAMRIKPYIGGGIGFTSLSTTIQDVGGISLTGNENNSSSSFAYQWMAGLSYKLSHSLDLFGEYRFLDMDSFQIRSANINLSGDYGYSASSVGMGLRWKF